MLGPSRPGSGTGDRSARTIRALPDPACGGGVTLAWPVNTTTVPSQRQAPMSAAPTARAWLLATSRWVQTSARRSGGTGSGICRHVLSAGCWAGADRVADVAAAPAERGRSPFAAWMTRRLTATAAQRTASRIARPSPRCRTFAPGDNLRDQTLGSVGPSAVQAMTVPASRSDMAFSPDRNRAAGSTPPQLGSSHDRRSRLRRTLRSADVVQGR
jgi:hypothetical protein